MKKIIITSRNAHFKIPYASKMQYTYEVPPISTVLGILRVLYGEDIDDFKFGYIFQYESKYTDIMKGHKINVSNVRTIIKNNNKVEINQEKPLASDWIGREYLYNCILKIYTDIDLPIKIDYCLTMGRANCLARLHLPIKDVELINKEGKIINQYTPTDIGKGIIKPITYLSKYDKNIQSFQTKIKHLRFNKEVDYDKNYDIDEEQNIFLWHYYGGEIFAVR